VAREITRLASKLHLTPSKLDVFRATLRLRAERGERPHVAASTPPPDDDTHHPRDVLLDLLQAPVAWPTTVVGQKRPAEDDTAATAPVRAPAHRRRRSLHISALSHLALKPALVFRRSTPHQPSGTGTDAALAAATLSQAPKNEPSTERAAPAPAAMLSRPPAKKARAAAVLRVPPAFADLPVRFGSDLRIRLDDSSERDGEDGEDMPAPSTPPRTAETSAADIDMSDLIAAIVVRA